MAAVEVRDLVKRFRGVTALDGVSLEVGEGEVFSLLGPNGSGKTTLLNVVAGVVRPDAGRVLVKGLEPSDPRARTLVGYMPQELGLYGELNAYENLAFLARLYGVRDAGRRIRELLEFVGLAEAGRRLVKTYSGGMKRRLAIAASLLHDPEVVLLDEPTTGLDPGMRREVWDLVKGLREEGKTVVLATHYMEEAEALSDRCAIMFRGRVLDVGSPDELKRRYGGESVVEIRVREPVRGLEGVLEKAGGNRVVGGGDSYKVFVAGDPQSLLPRLVEACIGSGARVLSVEVHEPNLEDVFIKLTGRGLE